jgi:hypothetical protein
MARTWQAQACRAHLMQRIKPTGRMIPAFARFSQLVKIAQ